MNKKSHIHFIGIGGIGMSSLAKILLEQQKTVSGSDLSKNRQTKELEKLGANCIEGHAPENIPKETTAVVFSSQVKRDNPEWIEAEKRGLPLLHRTDLLIELMEGKKSLLVAGSHGKTTTSALLATVLHHAELHPSWMVGGVVKPFESNGAFGSGDHFVSECDESDGTHLKYFPYGLIVTNIDNDHMDYFKTEEKLVESFKALIYKTKRYEHLFWWGDDPTLSHLGLPGVAYGFSAGCSLRVTKWSQDQLATTFDLFYQGKNYHNIRIPLLGKHNVLNATAVFGLSLSLGVSEEAIRKGFLAFGGCKRRIEIIGETRKALFIDDYAHHPNEVKATLSAVTEAYADRRLIVIFQPHRYSRTRELATQFMTAFHGVDLLYITDIYAAQEAPVEGISGRWLASKIPDAAFLPKGEILSRLEEIVRPFDVVLFLGAGDITQVAHLARANPVKRFSVALLAGGRSLEHEVSFLSACQLLALCDQNLYEIEVVLFSKRGEALFGEEAQRHLHDYPSLESGNQSFAAAIVHIAKQELVFPVLHGPFGEDGRMQGVLDLLNIPYLGTGYEGSTYAMNKAVTKRLAEAKGVPVGTYFDFTRYEWDKEPVRLIKQCSKMAYPLFVKPVHLGSTVGISRVQNEEELAHAIAYAFTFDHHLIVEEGVEGREIEFAIIGSGPYQVFTPGEILTNGQVYDYEAKYGKKALISAVPAEMPDSWMLLGKEIALQAYRAALMDGMARVDLFLRPNGQFLLNEINPIPGFTLNSLFPRMCAYDGLKNDLLINKLVLLALKKKRDQDKIHS